jgi:hypothetical protein
MRLLLIALLFLGCQTDPDLMHEWTLLGMPKAKVESVLTKAGYAANHRGTLWSPVEPQWDMRSILVFYDSDSQLVHISLIVHSVDVTSLRKEFDKKLKERRATLGTPKSDSADASSGHRFYSWEVQNNGKIAWANLDVRDGVAGTGSYLEGFKNPMRR